jgi:hypothetical protein
MTVTLPFFAPLFDKMVAHDDRRRFTANEALLFFEEHAATVAEVTLMAECARGRFPRRSYERYDRWANVPPALAQAWDRHREKPSPHITSVSRPAYGL